MGEEKEKEKEKKGEGGESKKKGGGGKDDSALIVLKTDLHCEGCAMKVKKVIRGIEGVDKVTTETTSNKIFVSGTADPWQVKEKLEAKMKRQVELISPANPPKKEKDKEKEKDKNKNKEKEKDSGAKDDGKKSDKSKGEKEKKSEDEKKPKELPESTVALKIRLHCEGCIDRIKRHIYKIKGVKEVTVDQAKDLVTVKGTMDAKSLPLILKEKLRRSVDIVNTGKDKGGDEKKENKDGGKGGKEGKESKKEKSPAAADGAEKSGAAAAVAEQRPAAAAQVQFPMMDANRYDSYAPYAPYGYRIEMVHAPQIFSDENPNACSIM